jgi:hypothetical protein
MIFIYIYFNHIKGLFFRGNFLEFWGWVYLFYAIKIKLINTKMVRGSKYLLFLPYDLLS